MAAACIKRAKGKNTDCKVVIIAGTAYHTGDSEDFEEVLAEDMRAVKFGSHEWVDVNGLVFDCKHHLGSSTIPHGRHTAASKDVLWNRIWANELGEQPKGDVFIRSHVHYHQGCFGPNWLAMTTPALQAAGTKYGARRCSGTVDYGFVVFDVKANGAYTWHAELAKLKVAQAKTITI
jgi:hypothetical protein